MGILHNYALDQKKVSISRLPLTTMGIANHAAQLLALIDWPSSVPESVDARP